MAAFPDLHSHRLHALLAPKSIAVVGVSLTQRNIGRIVAENLVAMNYGGSIVCVGRRSGTAGTMPVVESLAEAGRVDLAVLVVPAEGVLPAIRQGHELGIKNYAIISAGFAEANALGADLQQNLAVVARDHKLAVLGPNTVGFINYAEAVNASFAPWWRVEGPLGEFAIISQSGGTAGAIMVLAARSGTYPRYVIGSGNEAALDLVDYLEYVGADPNVRTIALYIEGVKRGRELLQNLGRMRVAGKRIVVLMAARQRASARAAVSHTGSVAAPGAVTRQILEDVGAVVVDTPQEAAAALSVLTSPRRLPKRGNVMIFADAGGSGVLAADVAEEHGLAVPELPSRTKRDLGRHVPVYGSVLNPVDPTPTVFSDHRRLSEVFHVAAGAGNVDVAVVASAHDNPGAVSMASAIAEAAAPTEKFTMAVWNAGSEEVAAEFRSRGIPYFDDPTVAFTALARGIGSEQIRISQIRTAIAMAARAGNSPESGKRVVLTEEVIETELEKAGVRVVPSAVVRTLRDARRAARALGYPVVLKALSKAIPHRAKVGAISINIQNETQLRQEYLRIEETVEHQLKDAVLEGMIVQSQALSKVEAFLGVHIVPGFGPVAVTGIGGSLVEVQPSLGFGLMPMRPASLERMIERSPLLKVSLGDRVNDFLDIAMAITGWWTERSHELRLVELDINPVMFDDEGAFVVDALAVARMVETVGEE